MHKYTALLAKLPAFVIIFLRICLRTEDAGLRPSSLSAAERKRALPVVARGLGGFAPIIKERDKYDRD